MNTTKMKSIGVAEFRERLSKHLLTDTPIAITQHGLTVGYYIPTQHVITAEDKRALSDVTRQLIVLLEQQGLDPEILIKEAQLLRKLDK